MLVLMAGSGGGVTNINAFLMLHSLRCRAVVTSSDDRTARKLAFAKTKILFTESVIRMK